MSVVYNTTLKNTRLTAVRDAIDAGAGAGILVIGTAALSGATGVLAQITLNDPSGTISGGVLTFSGFPKSDSSADATGAAAKAEIRDSTGTVVVSGLTVGTSAADIILNSVAIDLAETVTINSATITHG